MILEANGKTFEIKLKELEVRLTLDLPNKGVMSGRTLYATTTKYYLMQVLIWFCTTTASQNLCSLTSLETMKFALFSH